jgi:hypothetical protein
MIYDSDNDACISIFHLNPDLNVSAGNPVTTDTKLGTYTDSEGHTHMGVNPGQCTHYDHANEMPIIFNEIGYVLSQTIQISGRVWVIDGSTTSPRIPFGSNAHSRLYFDQGDQRANLEVCADNLSGQNVFVKFWREGRWWNYSQTAQANCITFWDMDGEGGVMTDRPYRAWVSIGAWPDTSWPVLCLYSTGRMGMCTQAQYPGESWDPAGTGLDCGQVSSDGVILYENPICNRDLPGRTKVFSNPTTRADIPDFNDITSSIYIPPGWSIKVFEKSLAESGGSWRCLTGSMWDLRVDNYTNGNTSLFINDTISSVQVYNNNNCAESSSKKTYLPFLTNNYAPTIIPIFVYPLNGQTIGYSGYWMFKVEPMVFAQGFLWGFTQNGVLVWENLRDEGSLSGNEYAISPGSLAQSHVTPGSVDVSVRAWINDHWSDMTIIRIYLE